MISRKNFQMVKKIIIAIIALSGVIAAGAQSKAPVGWNVTVSDNSANGATVNLTATIENGWHLYGLRLPEDGPNGTTVTFDLPEGVKTDGELTASTAPTDKFDGIFSLNLPQWEGNVTLSQRLTVKDGCTHEVSGTIRYQACNGLTCVAPQKVPFTVTVGTGHTASAEENPSAEESVVKGKNAIRQSTKADENDEPEKEEEAPAEMPTGKMLFMAALTGGIAGGLIASIITFLWFNGYTRRILKRFLNHQPKAKSNDK